MFSLAKLLLRPKKRKPKICFEKTTCSFGKELIELSNLGGFQYPVSYTSICIFRICFFFKKGHANETIESNCQTGLMGMIVCLINEDFMGGIQRVFSCSNAMGVMMDVL